MEGNEAIHLTAVRETRLLFELTGFSPVNALKESVRWQTI